MKAIFCDFYGTVVQESGPVAQEVIWQAYQGSTARSPEEVVRAWWEMYRRRIDTFCGDDYRPQHELALESFQEVLAFFGSPADPVRLRDRMSEHWRNPPLFEDARHFLNAAPLPVYFMTNSDNHYIKEAMQVHGLQAAGVVTSEQARYSKPRAELFQYALDTLGFAPRDVIHIGDSLDSDVYCPTSVGIQALWLNRANGPVPEGITAVENLAEALAVVERVRKAGRAFGDSLANSP